MESKQPTSQPTPTPRIRKDKNQKLTKEAIGLPQDFRHLKHIDVDPGKSFGMDHIDDPQLKPFFNNAGVQEWELQDLPTREFICDFINENGGLAAVEKELGIQTRPMVTLEELKAKKSGTASLQSQQIVLPPMPAPRKIIGGRMSIEPPSPFPRSTENP